MLGYGTYTALSAHKSWGYTSASGSRWAHGKANRAFMGLYATAYGNPWYIDQIKGYTAREVRDAGFDCVHALASKVGLRKDEIVFYDEAATVLDYLVEFEA